eukprot:Nk52_evm15s249 gene=Nk52_evmTU15s249
MFVIGAGSPCGVGVGRLGGGWRSVLGRCMSTGGRKEGGRAMLVDHSMEAGPLSPRAVVSIKGRDAFKFLQGLTTKDLRLLTERKEREAEGLKAAGPLVYTAFLNRVGRVMFDAVVYDASSGWGKENNRPEEKEEGSLPATHFYMDCDASLVDMIMEHFRLYKVRSKVKFELESSLAAYSYIPANLLDQNNIKDEGRDRAGDREYLDSQRMFEKCNEFCGKKELGEANGEQTILCGGMDPRLPGGELGVRFIATKEHSAGLQKLVEEEGKKGGTAVVCGEEAVAKYRRVRHDLGVPEGSEEIRCDQEFPFQCNFDVMNGVDFDKGCYLGQELTARTRYRGMTRRRIMPLTISGTALPPAEVTDAPLYGVDAGTEEGGRAKRKSGVVRGCVWKNGEEEGGAGIGLVGVGDFVGKTETEEYPMGGRRRYKMVKGGEGEEGERSVCVRVPHWWPLMNPVTLAFAEEEDEA